MILGPESAGLMRGASLGLGQIGVVCQTLCCSCLFGLLVKLSIDTNIRIFQVP